MPCRTDHGPHSVQWIQTHVEFPLQKDGIFRESQLELAPTLRRLVSWPDPATAACRCCRCKPHGTIAQQHMHASGVAAASGRQSGVCYWCCRNRTSTSSGSGHGCRGCFRNGRPSIWPPSDRTRNQRLPQTTIGRTGVGAGQRVILRRSTASRPAVGDRRAGCSRGSIPFRCRRSPVHYEGVFTEGHGG